MAVSEFVVKLGVDSSALNKAAKAADSVLGKLGSSRVKIAVDDSQVDSAKEKVDGLSGTERVVLDVDTKGANSAVDGFGSKVGGLSSIVGGALGGAAFAGISKLTTNLFEGAIAGDKLGDSLELAFSQAGVQDVQGAVEQTTKANLELANSLGQDVKRVDELSAASAGLAGASGKLNTDLTKAALGIENLSGGAVKGEAVIKALSRGLADPEGAAAIDALAKKYPQLADTLRSNISPQEKVIALNKELGTTFETLEEQAKGPDAVIQQLKNNLARGFEQAGVAIMDALGPAISEISNAITPLIQQIGPVIGKLVETIGPVLGTLGTTLAKTFESLAPVLLQLFDAIGPVIAQLTGTVGTLVQRLVTGLAPTLGLIANVAGVLLKAIAPIIDALGDALGPIIDTVVASVGDLAKSLGPLVVTLVTALAPVIELLARLLGVGINIALKLVTGLITGIVSVISGFVQGITSIVGAVSKWVNSFGLLRDIFGVVKKAFADFINILPDFVKEALGFKQAESDVKAVGNAAGKAGGEIKSTTNETKDLNKELDKTGNKDKPIGKVKTAFEKAREAIDKLRKAQAQQLDLQQEVIDRQIESGKLTKEQGALQIQELQEGNTKQVLALAQKQFAAQVDEDGFAIQTKFKGPDAEEAESVYNALAISVSKGERQIAALQGAEQQKRLQGSLDIEKRNNDARIAINQLYIKRLERDVAASNFQDVEKLVAANLEGIRVQTDVAVDAIVQATPEYVDAAAKIGDKLAKNLINADEAKKQLADLRTTIFESLTASEGANVLGEQIRAILDDAQGQAADIARGIQDAAADAQVGTIRSDTVRAIEEQVRGLEKQRDLLLRNTALTEVQRKQIEQGYGQAIDKVRKGSFNLFQSSVDVLAQSLSDIQVNLESDEAQQQLEDLAKANDDLIASFERGEITYQDALAGLQQATEGQVGLLSKLGDAAGQALSQVLTNYSASFKTGAEETIATVAQLQQDVNKIRKDTTITDESERAKQIARVNEEIATSQVKAIEQLGAAGAAEFAALVVSGENVGDSLKKVAGDLAKSLLALYTPGIVALFSQIIPPPFGQIAGFAAVASLQALLSTALASFADGGYTGDGGKYQTAGIVHAGEFVAPQTMTRKHRGLLEHLYANKPLESFPSIQKMLDANRITVANEMRNGIYAPSSSQAMQVGVDLSPMVSELRAMRSQLEAMETLQKTSTDVVVSADKDAVIRDIRKANFRKTRR